MLSPCAEAAPSRPSIRHRCYSVLSGVGVGLTLERRNTQRQRYLAAKCLPILNIIQRRTSGMFFHNADMMTIHPLCDGGT